MAVGCPCDISAMFPLGLEAAGGFNITLTISGLDTNRPKATGLSCLFNDVVEVPAKAVSVNKVQCVAPAAILVTNSSTNATGENQIVPVSVKGALFLISRSTQNNKMLKYFQRPTFDFGRISPGTFISTSTHFSQRTITVYGANFRDDAGGMYLRLSKVNGSIISIFGQVPMTLVDATLATAIIPPSPDPGVFRLELSINSDTWYHPGDIEYVRQPMITSVTPSSGRVMGGSRITVTHELQTFPSKLGTLEARVGQFYVPLNQISATQMELSTPPHTVEGDPGWFLPGNESLELYLVVTVNPFTGIKTRFRYDAAGNGTNARFSYECSENEQETKTCCPAGTAGPGGNGGAFCFTCESGKFAPLAGTAACDTCPPNSVSHNSSANCTCEPGYEFQIISHPAQRCLSCAAGKYRNTTMSSCSSCPTGTRVSPERTSCRTIFRGCPDPTTYQPSNDTEMCCLKGEVLQIPATACTPCPPGTFFNSSSRVCMDCTAGKYGATSGLLNCSTCMSGTYARARQTTCLNCPANSTSIMGAKNLFECTCVAGMARTSRAEGPVKCSLCYPGTYMVMTAGQGWCDACPEGKSSPPASTNIANCTCAPNWYQNGSYVPVNSSNWIPEGECDECPEGTASYMANNMGPGGIYACACPAGFAAQHSRAGQAGCGHDPCCGGPCPQTTSAPISVESTATSTTTPTPTPMPTTTPTQVTISCLTNGTNDTVGACNTTFIETTALFRQSSTSPAPTSMPTTTPSPTTTTQMDLSLTTPLIVTPTPAPLGYCVDGNECMAPRADDWLGSAHMVQRCHANAT